MDDLSHKEMQAIVEIEIDAWEAVKKFAEIRRQQLSRDIDNARGQPDRRDECVGQRMAYGRIQSLKDELKKELDKTQPDAYKASET